MSTNKWKENIGKINSLLNNIQRKIIPDIVQAFSIEKWYLSLLFIWQQSKNHLVPTDYLDNAKERRQSLVY